VATSSNSQIDGINHEHLKGGRALQTENPDDDMAPLEELDDSLFDVCAHAKELGEAAQAATMTRLKDELDGMDLVADRLNDLQRMYPLYFESCQASIRSLTSTRADELDADDDELDADEWRATNGAISRELQNVAYCEPPVDQGPERLKVAFHEHTNTKMCEEQEATASMSEMCSKFCEPVGVPLLLGSKYYGFSLEQMNSICLAHGQSGETSVDECARDLALFNDVKWKTSDFLAQYDVFVAAKISYITSAQDSVKKISEYMASEAMLSKMKWSSSKVHTFKEEIARQRSEAENSAAKKKLNRHIEQLKAKAESLRKTLARDSQKIMQAFERCNGLFTASGNHREYLLDICAQGSGACIDTASAEHMGCCCVYNPIGEFGSASKAVPRIHGLSAAIPGMYRRLVENETAEGSPAEDATTSESLVAEIVDVCASAWTQAASPVNAFYLANGALGKKEMQNREQQLKDKYDRYCKLTDDPQVSTSTTTTPTTSSSASTTTTTGSSTSSSSTTTTTISTAGTTDGAATTPRTVSSAPIQRGAFLAEMLLARFF
jgi:hypothetical protein